MMRPYQTNVWYVKSVSSHRDSPYLAILDRVVEDEMNEGTITRREMLRLSGTATAGVAASLMAASASHLSGLAAEYDRYDALGLAELVARGEVTPLELLHAVRLRAESLQPRLNCFSALFFEKAEAHIEAGLPEGPFRGVPFALKDISHQLSGTATTNGSRLFQTNVPDFDSTLVERYKKAGLVIIGKTTSPELGLSPSTESVLFGRTHNPWSLERTPGGSSGGTAAAVASRILPIAHGSDGGGSIRIPASCCGVFGLKPTRARTPLGPTQFEGWNGLSTHHALSLSVRDSAALLDVSSGAEPGSPYWAPPPERTFPEEVKRSPGKLRMAMVLSPASGVPVDPECLKAAEEAAKLCEELGHSVEEARLPERCKAVGEVMATLVFVSVARTLEDAGAARGRPVTESDVEAITWANYQSGLSIPSVAYSRAINTCHQIGLAMARFQENFDVILSPTLAKPPIPLGILSLSAPSGETYGRELQAFMPFTQLYNITGLPSMSVPLHWTADGLPVGVMFSARFGDEAVLFRLAAQLEQARPWAGKRPPV
jgi:Asp-tRNA(Asn)/Glu-tRNA(Gln) amidotransferase A subunit family amidase